MKHLLSILLISSICLTQEMEVDGDLKVTGNIQNQMIDSLLQVIQDLQSQLSALQVENRLETRIFEKSLSWSQNAEEFNFNLQEITGFDLQTAIVNFYSIKDLTIFLDIFSMNSFLSLIGLLICPLIHILSHIPN